MNTNPMTPEERERAERAVNKEVQSVIPILLDIVLLDSVAKAYKEVAITRELALHQKDSLIEEIREAARTGDIETIIAHLNREAKEEDLI